MTAESFFSDNRCDSNYREKKPYSSDRFSLLSSFFSPQSNNLDVPIILCSQESEHQSQIEELKQEIEQRQYQINELDEEISHVRGNVEELQHELQAKGQEILSVRREANSQIR